MLGIEQLLKIANAYSEATGLELSTVSWRSMGDTKKLTAIVGGADIQVRRLEKTLRWFSANWPDAAEWPADIERPDPVNTDAAATVEHEAAAD